MILQLKKYPKPDFIYTMPSHQFPLGSIMSISRRIKLLEYANKTNAWIIEDDYDSEFRYSGSPLPSLQGMDKFGRVIYIGTFSKVLFPGLRLGYLVLPDEELMETFAVAKTIVDRQSPIFDQIVLTKFIEEGHSDAGMHIITWLNENFSDKKVCASAKESGLAVYPLSEYVIKYKRKPGLIMGYTGFNKDKLKEGVGKLKKILETYKV